MNVPWWTLVTQRSAEVTIDVGSLLRLLSGFGSPVAEATDAVLVTVVAVWDEGTLTTTEMGAACCRRAEGATAVQLTSLPEVAVQSHALPPSADTRVKGDGTESVTVSGRASDGPSLVTVRV